MPMLIRVLKTWKVLILSINLEHNKSVQFKLWLIMSRAGHRVRYFLGTDRIASIPLSIGCEGRRDNHIGARDVTHSITRVWPYLPLIRDTFWPGCKSS